jgi:SAM-dependent methyltransferase
MSTEVTNSPDDKWLAGDAYELYMGRWSRRLARTFLEWLRPAHSVNWLEVGCGTGALTSAICTSCRPASVVACDPSAPFVEHARNSLAGTPATFVVGGADQLPHRDGGFEIGVSGLVFNFLTDPGLALAAIRERLRPGGTVAVYVWDYADGMEFLRIFWEEAAALNSGADAVDERRRFPLCRQPALAALFEHAGLADVETASIEIPTDFAGFDDYWSPFLRGTGPAPSYAMSLDPSTRALLEQRLRERLPVGDDGCIHLRARAWAARGIAI